MALQAYGAGVVLFPEKNPWERHEQLSKHSKPPEEAAAGIHTWNKGPYSHRHRQKSMAVCPSSSSSTQGFPIP